ncbi:hypothetical protein ACVBEF_12185 [Glaciimonas sp. GG7]
MLLGIGYRMVDASANKGPGMAGPRDDAVAVAYISQNAGDMFKATAAEYNHPGKLGGPLTPEQAVLPGAVGNPVVGLAVAGAVTGGLTIAGTGTGAVIASATDVYAAYKAAMAGYSTGAALRTGVATGGGASYTGMAAGGAVYDKVTQGQNIAEGLDQQFSISGLATAMTVGGLTSMYGTAMFGWAGVPNSITNWVTVPGFIIRANSGVFGSVAGQAVQGAVKSSSDR